MLTGRYQQYFGWYDFKEALVGIPKNEMMIQEYLKSLGYATALIGKWHLGYHHEIGPLHRGFDRFYGFLGGQHDYFDPRLGDPTVGFPLDYDAYVFDQKEPVQKMDYLTDELTQRSIQFIEEQTKSKKPFFLYLAYNTPHPPMQAKWEKLEKYALKRSGKFNHRDITRAMIDSLDDGIGRIMTKLKELEIERDTLIIFTSDNGGADDRGEGQPVVQHNGGLRPRKGFLWEGGIRVPFILHWPKKLPTGITYIHPVSHLDIFATIVGITKPSQLPKPLDGINLLPYLQGKIKNMPHQTLFWGFESEVDRWAIRKGKWKLTRDVVSPKSQYDGTNVLVTELHDLENDPEERINLSAKYPEKVKELTELKEKFYTKCMPTIATQSVISAWQKDLQNRREKLPHSEQLRRDGAPGHWL